MNLPDRATLFAVCRRALMTAPTTRLNPAIVDVAGSDVNLLFAAMSLMGEEISAALADCLEAHWSDTASADKLDRLAFDRYGLVRLGSTPATCTIRYARPAVGASGTIPAGSRVQTVGGAQFATDTDLTFGGSDLAKTVNATAILVGPDSNVAPNQIVRIVDSTFDSTFACTNPSWAAGGTDSEDDPHFRGRIRDFFTTLRRGTLGAIEFGARQVAGVSVSKAIELVDLLSHPTGVVQLVIGDQNGNASSTMIQQVIDELLTFRAGGVEVDVLGGQVTYQPVTWALQYQQGVDQAKTIAEVRAVTVAVTQFLAPGETMHCSTLIAAARTVPGVILSDASLVVPNGDIIPTSNNVILRTRPTDVTI
jgi:uncharacterized phage protein gp47/JayE